MNESFFQEPSGESANQFSWETVKHTPEEDIVVHHGEGSEYDSLTLRSDLPDIKERIERLEMDGWRVVNKGDFVVLERDHPDTKKTIH